MYRSDEKIIGDMTSSTHDNPGTSYVTNGYKSGYNNNYENNQLMRTRTENTMA